MLSKPEQQYWTGCCQCLREHPPAIAPLAIAAVNRELDELQRWEHIQRLLQACARMRHDDLMVIMDMAAQLAAKEASNER